MDVLEARIKGWERRGIYDDPNLTQIVKMYEELGFIVRLDPFRPGMEDGCNECMKENPDRYKLVYTNKKDSK